MYRVCSCDVQFFGDAAEARARMDEDGSPASRAKEATRESSVTEFGTHGDSTSRNPGHPRGAGLRAGIVRRLHVQRVLAAGGATSAGAIGETVSWRNKSQGSSNKLLVGTRAPPYRYPVPGVTAPLSHQPLCRLPGDAAGGSAVGAHCGL